MKNYVLLASSAMLAACSANADGVSSASSNAVSADAVDRDVDAELTQFFEDYDKKELSFSPIGKAFRGIIDEDYGKWGDASDAAEVARYERGRQALAEMERRFDPADLDNSGKLSYRLFQVRADRAAAAFPFRKNHYIFDQMNGVQSRLPALMINIHRVANKSHAEAYISRLAGVEPQMDELISQTREQAKNGVMVPDWVYPYVINDSKNVISGAPFDDGDDSPIFADLKKKVNALDIPDAEKADLIDRGSTALTENFGPAYRRLIAEMERQQATAVDGDGVWRFKDGAAYYAERLKKLHDDRFER